jgi:hypothetical protein
LAVFLDLDVLAGFLAGVAFFPDFALAGATRRACFAALAFVGAFGSGVSVVAAGASRVVLASFSIVFMALSPWR